MSLNHIYRLLWSEVLEAWIPVAENVRRKTKRSGNSLLLVLPAIFLSGYALAQVTTVVSTGGNTSVYQAANGVPVVNINTANSAGLSHNQYTNYNIDSRGLVLNNGNLSQIARQSQLAGAVAANPNLAAEARVILNEVVSTNRSTLAGFTEVLGGQADVVVVNPNGITCNGCGFINTDRVTLTTGAPAFGADGGLVGFNVSRGDILIGGTGFNATAQQTLDLVARSIKLEGQINGGASTDLQLTAGTNAWNYASRTVTGAVVGSGTAPSYAIDTSQLGGMYAGKIRLIATEEGVGVRMLGEAAASASDFMLSSTGEVEIRASISAQHNLSITTTATSSDALAATDSTLSARNDVTLAATSGGLSLAGGVLTANNNLIYDAASINDVATGTVLSDNNKRYAGNTFRLASAGGGTLDGVSMGAGGRLVGDFDSLLIGSGGATLYSKGILDLATAGNMTLATATISATNDLSLTSSNGRISTSAGSNQGIQSTVGNLSISAANGLSNSGTMLADAGSLTFWVGGGVVNNGYLYAAAAMTLSDSLGGATESISNTGKVLSDGTLTMSAADITNNNGTIQATTGTTVNAASLRNLGSESKILLSTTQGADGSVNLTGTLHNEGNLQSTGGLSITSGGALSNTGSLLALRSSQGGNNEVLSVSAMTIDNGGTIDSGGALNLTATSTAVGATTFNNSGSIQSGGAITLSVGNKLVNQPSAGQIIGDTSVTITSTAATFSADNAGRIQSGSSLTLGNAGHSLVLTNLASGTMRAGATLDLTGGNLNNRGKIYADSGTHMNIGSLVNGGAANSEALIIGAMNTGEFAINASGTIDNYGAIHSNKDLAVRGGSITNRSNGGISSLNSLGVTATGSGTIDNYGALYAGGALNLTATGGSIFNRTVTGTIDSGGLITSSSANFTNNNSIVASGNITITATNSFTNETTLASGVSITKSLSDPINVVDGVAVWLENENSSSLKDANKVLYQISYYRDEKLNGITEDALAAMTKAQIIGNGSNSTLTINYGNAGKNYIGVLSAPTVNIVGTGTFTNEDLSLYRYQYNTKWIEQDDSWINSSLKKVTDYSNWGRTLSNADPSAISDSTQWESLDGYDNKTTARQWSIDHGQEQTGASTLRTFGSGIYATNFNFTGGTLNNVGSPWPTDPSHAKASAAVTGTISSPEPTPDIASVVKSNVVAGTMLSFSGLNLSLPTNPNGYFVVSIDPKAKYLIETNPLFSVGSAFDGSDYLLKQLGLNPDQVIKRLGDSNYEAYLIRQQLIQQTGSNILNGYKSEAAQLDALMDHAAIQASTLKLTIGKALTEEQIAGLSQDIIWMEEVIVSGQKVLAPRIYLAKASRDMVVSGAAIVADKVNVAGDALTNTGGTVKGTETVIVEVKGDIKNTSGSIQGGNVSLTSTEGSIVNQTLVENQGESSTGTAVGKTGSIKATGNLDLSAKKEITVLGADVKAGGDATLSAGGNITFDTIVDRASATTSSVIDNGTTTTTVKTEKNIGSTLTTGGNLRFESGGDTTLAGSKVNVGGNLTVESEGDFNVISRQDKITTSTETKTSGWGVGGGAWGTEKTTVDDFEGKNFGSTLNVGGNASITATKDMTVQGSDVHISRDGSITARSVKILDGLDEKRTTTTTETQTYLSVGTENGSNAEAQAAANSGSAAAQAGAGAGANVTNSSELNLSETRTTKTDYQKTTSVGSSLSVGGKLDVTATETLTVQGSSVESQGDLTVKAKNIEVLTGRNTETTTITTTTTKVGVFVDSGAKASSGSEANATGMTATADASANAGAEASTNATAGVRYTETTEKTDSLTNTASTIKSGGNMSLTATQDATFVGAKVESGGDMSITAVNINNLAAEDKTTYTKSSTSVTGGLMVGGEAKAETSASTDTGNFGLSGAANIAADGKAEIGGSAGLVAKVQSDKSEEGSTTNQVSTFKAGGNLTRAATDTITDQGTQLEATGDITQTATTLKEISAENRQWSSQSTETHEGKLEYKVGEGVSVSEGLNNNDNGLNTTMDIGSGHASYSYGNENSGQLETQAVTSSYKSGGSISSTTTGSTTLIGTQFEAGKDITIGARSLDYQAAKDSSTTTETSRTASGAIGASSTAIQLDAGYGQSEGGKTSTTAKVGTINAGGNLSITTTGDTRLEGADITASKAVTIKSTEGDVKLEAAKSTTSEKSEAFGLEGTLVIGEGQGEFGGKGNYSRSEAETTTNTVTNIKGGAITVEASKKDVVLEGAKLDSAGDVSLTAGGDVKLLEAKDTEKGYAVSLGGKIDVAGEKGGGEAPEGNNSGSSTPRGVIMPSSPASGSLTPATTTSGTGSTSSTEDGGSSGSGAIGVRVKIDVTDKQTGNETTIQSGGKLTINAKTVVNQGTDLGAAKVTGDVQAVDTTNVDIGVKLDLKAGHQ